MFKPIITFLLLLSFFSGKAHNGQPAPFSFHQPAFKFSIAEKEKQVYFLLPNSCSGLIGELIEGHSTVSIFVEGKIKNGEAHVQVRMEYKGAAKSTIAKTNYTLKGKLNLTEVKALSNGSVDIPLKGHFTLSSKNAPRLYLSDLGYITANSDGSVVSHILNSPNFEGNSHPNIYCSKPAN